MEEQHACSHFGNRFLRTQFFRTRTYLYYYEISTPVKEKVIVMRNDE